MNAVLEGAVIGFGVVGAVVAGNAAANMVKRSGGSESEALAAGCVGAGLSAALLPAAAVAGVAIVAKKGYDLATKPEVREAIGAKFEAAKQQTNEALAQAKDKVRRPKLEVVKNEEPAKPVRRTKPQAAKA